MTDLETRLEQAFRADDPAPRDPKFRVELLARREQGAFRRRMLHAALGAAAITILAAFGLGAIDHLAPESPWRLAAVAAMGIVAVGSLAAPWLGAFARLRRAESLFWF
jgi:hypothetical protein